MHTQTQLPQSKFVRPTGWYKHFGLYDQQNQAPIPLKQILVDSKINEYIAEISYSQLYYNNQDVKLETVYFFPIPNTGCFHNFKAKIGKRVIEGVIKKKAEAKQEYEQSIANNELAIYAETLEQDSSVMCIKIGNLPPHIEIHITISYIERVEISMNKFWSFSLSSTFLPRSMWSSSDEHGILTNYAQTDLSRITSENIHAMIGFNWDVNILINSKRPFELVDSPSHKITVEKTEVSGFFSAKVSLSADKACLPSKDFVLNYSTDAINTPNCLIGPFDKGYCALVSFCPNTGYLRYDDAYTAFLQGKSPFDDLLSKAKNEFYFVIDRSENMTLKKTQLANEVLSEFLNRIPSESYFNILEYAESINPFEQRGVEASTANIQRAINFYEKTSTGSSKVRIESLFNCLARAKLKDDYPRILVILSPGQIDTTVTESLRIMRDRLQRTRVFTVGIGSGSRTDFVVQTAIQGYGTYNVIRSKSEVKEKVSHVLRTSVAPFFTDFEFDIETKGIHSCVVPVPKSIKYVMPDELVEFFVIFNQRFNEVRSTKFTLKFKNDLQNCTEKYEGEISLENMDPLRTVVMLGIQKLCASHMEEIEIALSVDNDTTRAMAENLKIAVENNSIQHGILTPHTAFICIDKADELQQTSQLPTQRVVITSQKEPQQIQSTDPRLQGEELPVALGLSVADTPSLTSTSNLYKFKLPNSTKLERDKGSLRLNDSELRRQSIEEAAFALNIPESLTKKYSHHKNYEKTAERDRSPKRHFSRIYNQAEEGKEATQERVVVDNYDFNQQQSLNVNRIGNIELQDVDNTKMNVATIMTKPANRNSDGNREVIRQKKTKLTSWYNWMRDLMYCKHIKQPAAATTSFDFKTNVLPRVLELQSKEGYWQATSALIQILGYKLEELMRTVPLSLNVVKGREEVWLTFLLFAWIDQIKETPDHQVACDRAYRWLKTKDENWVEHLERAKMLTKGGTTRNEDTAMKVSDNKMVEAV